MTNNFQKFGLLMWKNWLQHKRNTWSSIFEILLPVSYAVLLVVIRNFVDPKNHGVKVYDRFCPLPINSDLCNYTNSPSKKFRKTKDMDYSLAYSPKNDKIENAIQIMNVFMSSINVSITALSNSTELVEYFNTPHGNTTLAGIQLDDSLYGNAELPLNLEVSIRFPSELRASDGETIENNWKTFLLYPSDLMAGPRSINHTTGGSPSYYREGFLGVQQVVTYLLIFAQDIKNIDLQKLPFIQMQRFPYPEFTEDPLLLFLLSFVGIIIIAGFVLPSLNTVKIITTEKEQQLKEAMKIMGLPNWLHWSAWFVKSFIFLFISVILTILLLKFKWYPGTNFTVFTYADTSVMLVFMTLYACSTITFGFAISVFFSKVNTATSVGAIVWYFSYLPYFISQFFYDSLGLSTKLLSSLFSNTAMAYGFRVILMYEGITEGIQWSNIWKSSCLDDSLTLGYIFLMLILDTFIYLLIALYFEAVFPGEYGVPQKWYFFCTPSFWCGQPRNIMVEDFSNSSNHDPRDFEKEPEHLTPGIQIINLKKEFQKKTVVSDLSLNMFENQITVLLGHNGAGKTTTMSILTGLLQPSAGTAIVGGYDIRTNMKNIRDSLGLCPQHNILFEELTVSEHLYFFSRLKGLKSSQVKQEIKKYLQLLELEPKANKMSKTLSGGMKRKLCVGIAMCGNSKVVMLDEPTAGLDPSARRALWDLIQSQKPGRTILLTTHFMDEADLLGDRIAIMAYGKLQCCGSSFFLKKRYGAGYYLIIEKGPNCQTSEVTKFLAKYIPNIKIQSNVGSELTYLLETSNASKFRTMLGNLESNSRELGIITFGISLTTLEEVFMKVGADHGQEETNDLREQDKLIDMRNSRLLTGMSLIKNQIIAMLMKRYLSILRSYVTYITALFLPVVFLIIMLVVGRVQITTELPPLEITLGSYPDPVILYDNDDTEYCNFYVNSIQHEKFNAIKVDNISDKMLELTRENPGNVRQSYLVGASFDGKQNIIVNKEAVTLPVINAWFNNDPYHTPPLALGLVLNSIYQKSLNSRHSIKFINHPLPYTAKSQINQLLQPKNMGFQISVGIGISMAYVTSIFILFYIRERVCKYKHLQFVSGIKVLVFWCINFFCDLLVYIIIAITIVITLAAFQEDGFASLSDLGRISLILLYFSVSILPLMYLASYLFEVPSTGFQLMLFFGVITGMVFSVIVQTLSNPNFNLQHVANNLHWGFLLLPHYSLCMGIQESYTLYAANKVCDRIYQQCVASGQQNCTEAPCLTLDYCCNIDQNYYKWEKGGIGRNIIISYSTALVLFGVVLVKEYRVFATMSYMIKSRIGGKFPEEVPDEDSDVSAEKNHIRNVPNNELFKQYTLVLKDVTKYYEEFLAVNGICLGVKKNECFGLLGINGAGKTTTFKMMTGDVKITYGEAWVQGYSVKNQLTSVQKLIGYCPQFDAVLNDLTARETLTIFCLIRGIPYSETRYMGIKLSRDFDFYQHLDKKVKVLSGGNKRKLSTAIALVGDPEIIYLDEPTTGMDPATKRFLWNALCKVRDSGKSLVLTSHSMEECEALCTRLAIMVNGNFKCLGSSQHLKNKFSRGYTITIKLKKQEGDKDNIDTEIIERYIKDNFPSSHLREKHQEMLTYYIPEKKMSWSTMFGILEDGKKELNIEDYTLGQTSLEQVFLSFTKYSESQDN